MPGRRELTFEDYVSILRRHHRLIIISGLLGISAGFILSIVIPEKYTSHTTILVEQPAVSDSYVKPVMTEDLNGRLASMQEQILSRTRLQRLIEQFGLYGKDVRRMPMEQLVERLRKSITVTPLSPMIGTRSAGLPGFSVDVTMRESLLAQQICAEITSMFTEQNSRLRQQQAEDTTQFLAKQLEEAKSKLDDRDAELAAFQGRYIGELPEDEKTNLDLLMAMTPRLGAAVQSLHQAQQDKTFTESLLSQQLSALKAPQEKESEDPQSPERQLRGLQHQLQSLRGHYTEDHPDVVKLKNEIAELRMKPQETPAQQNDQNREAAQETISEPPGIQQLRARLNQIDLTISQRSREEEELRRQTNILENKIQSNPTIHQQFSALTREHQIALDFYNDLLKKRNEAQMATELVGRQQGEQFQVLDPPSLPERPSFPKPSLFSLGGLGVGVLLGLGAALLLEFLNKWMWTKEDVEFYLKVPILALVPSIPSAARNKKATVGKTIRDQQDQRVVRMFTA